MRVSIEIPEEVSEDPETRKHLHALLESWDRSKFVYRRDENKSARDRVRVTSVRIERLTDAERAVLPQDLDRLRVVGA